MTPEQSYEALIVVIKFIGAAILVITAVVVLAHTYAPDMPDDDGERM